MDKDVISACAFFEGLDEAELAEVARVAHERVFNAGQPLMSEGDFGYCMFVIESGSAGVNHDGQQVATIGPGAIVGEIGVLAGRRTASVVATETVRALEFFKRDVWRLEETCPGVRARFEAAMEQHQPQEPPQQLL
jgi:CRP-like cAMP-binding protein